MKIRTVAPGAAPLSLLLSADPSRERVERYLANGAIFVGEERGETIAVAVLERNGPEFELRNIAVAEAWQRRGLGRQMLKHVLAHAAAEGAARVTVGTGNSSLGQLAFYQRAGFRITSVMPGFFDGYEPPIVENGIACRDMIRLTMDLTASVRTRVSEAR
jgi:ribosomal protein S18 acetylase RimI-like enzyme